MFSIYTGKEREILILTELRLPVRRSEQHERSRKLKHSEILTHDAVRRVANLLWMRLEHEKPPRNQSGRSNRENGTTFWAVPLFLGILQSGEPIKRFSFSPKPEFSEFLTKLKAPLWRGRQAEEKISHVRTVLSPRYLYYSSLMKKRYLAMWIWLSEDK